MKSRTAGWMSAAALTALTAIPVHAHHLPPGMEDVDEFEDGAAFMAGIRHFVSGMDHWFFALAVGAMAVAVMRKRDAKNLVGALWGGGILGVMLGINQVVIPAGGASWLFALLAPLMVYTLRDRLSGRAKAAVIALVSLSQGNVHGVAWPLETASGFYATGLVCALAVFSLSGYGLAWLVRKAVVLKGAQRPAQMA